MIIVPRENSQPDSAGRRMVKVTLSGSSLEVVCACFQEGNQKIHASIEYDRNKKERNRRRRILIGDQKLKIAQESMIEKFQGPKDETIQRRDNALTAKLKQAMNKNKRQSSFPKTPNTTKTFNKKKNPFGALMEDSEDDDDDDDDDENERKSSQAKRNNERLKRNQINSRPIVSIQKATLRKKVLTGWATMASKPATPQPQQEKANPQQTTKQLEFDDGLSDEEVHHGGWDMNVDEW
tara:strand:+ start:152 stop:862 length:711 start_codon:yes stop_codon:yes gene_type:complete